MVGRIILELKPLFWQYLNQGISVVRKLRYGSIFRKICAFSICVCVCVFFFVTYSNYSALERTLFYDHVPSDRHMELWEVNNKVHRRGLEIVKPGKRCSDVARDLNEIYMEHNILQYRVIGYGHSTGILSHYYGRDWGLEFLEHVDTVLEPGMVITMEPMIVVPEGQPGAGGYREHDTLIITETGVENTTASFPIGPEQNIVKN